MDTVSADHGRAEWFAQWSYPRLIAHRGAGKRAPENTLAALRCGASFGYRMFEFDVNLTADGQPVLLHDPTLERTTNGQGPLAVAMWGAVAQLDAGSWHSPDFAGEAIPGLHNVARWCCANGYAANIEIKPSPGREHETGAVVAAVVAEAWKNAKVALPLLSSFAEEALQGARAAAPDLPRALLVQEIPPDLSSRLERLGCVAVVVAHEALRPEVVQACHAQHYRVLTYTANDPERVAALLAWGVDGVITDAVDQISPNA